MNSLPVLLILGGCLLGTIQLLAGIAIGIWLRRGDAAEAHRNRQAMIRSQAIAKKLQSLVADISSGAFEHRRHLDEASQRLATAERPNDDALAELVVEVIGGVVRANQELQSKLHSAESRLQEQAAELQACLSNSVTDPLTGLPNRREFNNRLEERMDAWNRRAETFSLLLLDLDHFKQLNDEHGHLAGDQMLSAFGRAVRRAVRGEDLVARIGGEEFAVLLPSTSLQQAIHVDRSVREAVAGVAIVHNGQRIAVTTSGGLATIQPLERTDSLMQRADAALYSAKAAGRDRTFLHDGSESLSVADYQARLLGFDASLDTQHWAEQHEQTSDAQHAAISAELAETCNELRRALNARSDPHELASK